MVNFAAYLCGVLRGVAKVDFLGSFYRKVDFLVNNSGDYFMLQDFCPENDRT